MKIMATSSKRSHVGIVALSASDPEAGHHHPHASTKDSWTLMGMSEHSWERELSHERL